MESSYECHKVVYLRALMFEKGKGCLIMRKFSRTIIIGESNLQSVSPEALKKVNLHFFSLTIYLRGRKTKTRVTSFQGRSLDTSEDSFPPVQRFFSGGQFESLSSVYCSA